MEKARFTIIINANESYDQHAESLEEALRDWAKRYNKQNNDVLVDNSMDVLVDIPKHGIEGFRVSGVQFVEFAIDRFKCD